MKKIITNAAIVACIASLTACSTNTQEQNTVIGAGTGAVAGGLLGSLATGAGSGWVIAAGAVVGGLIGGAIGYNMDNSDTTHVNSAMDENDINEPASWQNGQTNNWYKIVPTSDVFTYQGHEECRKYVAYGKGKHHHKTVKTQGIACRMDNGMWKQIK